MTRHEDSNAEQETESVGLTQREKTVKLIKTTGTMTLTLYVSYTLYQFWLIKMFLMTLLRIMYEIRARKEAWPARIGLVNPPE